MLVNIVVEEKPPNKKQEVEITKKDRFKVVKSEHVIGTRRIRRFKFRIKTST